VAQVTSGRLRCRGRGPKRRWSGIRSSSVGRVVYVALSRDELSMGFGLSVVTNAQPISGQSALATTDREHAEHRGRPAGRDRAAVIRCFVGARRV
jgi:hypothetical protein